jgi:hypothetical protein
VLANTIELYISGARFIKRLGFPLGFSIEGKDGIYNHTLQMMESMVRQLDHVLLDKLTSRSHDMWF